MVSPVPAFFINIVCILLLMILGCHNVIMYNHSTFVLGYLLLQGYDVTGQEYLYRVAGLLVGMVLCMAIFYKNQKNRPYRRSFLDLFREFNISSARNRWYIRLSLVVSSAMLFMSLLGLPRAMWAGIASMSVCLPFPDDCKERAGKRAAFNIVGCLLFVILYLVLPESMYPYIGMIGGIGVGYSAGYAWQTVEEKTAMLLRHHIAIWDVIQSCDIKGSSDSSIKNVTPTDLKQILDHCQIRQIYANGNKAGALYKKYQQPLTERDILVLPSTSPANAAWSLDRLYEKWSEILR